MKQLMQSYRTGALEVVDVAAPSPGPGTVLVANAYSVVSPGTEIRKVTTARKGLVSKARSRPDLVRQVIHNWETEGARATIAKVRSRLDRPVGLGYSSSGTIVGLGEDVSGFRVGDRVACGGEGYAAHADLVCIPEQLCVAVPPEVALEHAAFTTLGAIALHGVRRADLQLDETAAVIGLGLIGQLSVKLLKAAGVRVIGLDLDPQRVAFGLGAGADAAMEAGDPALAAVCDRMTGGVGVDAVLITASTASSGPVQQAPALLRDRGRVVVIGQVGMSVPHSEYYLKEISLGMSRSYGPGRYDPIYELSGVDYPVAYVRWTERRNMEAFLRLLATGRVDVGPLITQRFRLEEAQRAYQILTGPEASATIGVLFSYPPVENMQMGRIIESGPKPLARSPLRRELRLGVVGAGNFAQATLLPALRSQAGVSLRTVVTKSPLTALSTARQFGFTHHGTDANEIFNDQLIDCVVIATRHDLHADLVCRALEAGKSVFVEKPLALSNAELERILRTQRKSRGYVMVGFNRRFAPMTTQALTFLSSITPRLITIRVNAGYVDPAHWSQDPAQGGRLIGEGCHFVDLLHLLSSSRPVVVSAAQMDNAGRYRDDNVVVNIEFANGSLGSLIYTAAGDRSLPKERIEIFGGGLTVVIDDFSRLELSRNGSVNRMRGARDKGHRQEMLSLVQTLSHGTAPEVQFEDACLSTMATLAAEQSLRDHRPIELEEIAALTGHA